MKTKYSIEFSKKYVKDLEKIPKIYRENITEKVAALSSDPRPDGCKKLRGQMPLYRLRCGDYRIVYAINDNVLLILVLEVGHRREIYR